jgi:arylsulfatase A-like enzyme
MYPSFHGVFTQESCLGIANQTLTEVLKEAGYRTLGISGIPQLSVVKRFNRGFDEYIEAWKVGKEQWSFRLLKGSIFSFFHRDDFVTRYSFEQLSEWIGGSDPSSPFFIFANFNTAHTPYHPPRRFRNRFTPKKQDSVNTDKLKNLALRDGYRYMAGAIDVTPQEFKVLESWYDGEIAYLDHMLGRLFKLLQTHDLFENTLIVLLSDHGENFGDHRLMYHQFCLYDSLIRIPMIWHYPKGIRSSGVVADVVSIIDVMPSILHFIGKSIDEDPYRHGRNLFSERSSKKGTRRNFVIAEYYAPPGVFRYFRRMTPDFDDSVFNKGLKCIRTHQYKYIIESTGHEELYNMVQDPEEEYNLMQDASPVARELRHHLFTVARQFGEEIDAKSSVEQDEFTIQKLKVLGYL